MVAICRFAEPIASTSVFPYLVRRFISLLYPTPAPDHLRHVTLSSNIIQPEMIESFGVEKAEVAKWAGSFSFIYLGSGVDIFKESQVLSSVFHNAVQQSFGAERQISLAESQLSYGALPAP
jgi:hypothetical protein